MNKKQINILTFGALLTTICAVIIMFFTNFISSSLLYILFAVLALFAISLTIAVVKKIEWLYKFILTCYYLGIIALLIYGAMAWTGFTSKFYDSDGKIRADLIAKAIGNQKSSEIIFILLSFLQVTFIPIPSTVSIIVGVILFGASKGFYLSLIGQVIGSMLAFYLGRKFGEKLIIWIIGEDSFLKYQEMIRGRDKALIFFMFLFPFFPDDILCMFAGLTTFTWLSFLLIMLLTRSVAIGYTSFGVELMNKMQNMGAWTYVIYGLMILFIVTTLIYVWKYGDKIEQKMIKLFDKIMPERLRNKFVSERSRVVYKKNHQKKLKQANKNNSIDGKKNCKHK